MSADVTFPVVQAVWTSVKKVRMASSVEELERPPIWLDYLNPRTRLLTSEPNMVTGPKQGVLPCMSMRNATLGNSTLSVEFEILYFYFKKFDRPSQQQLHIVSSKLQKN